PRPDRVADPRPGRALVRQGRRHAHGRAAAKARRAEVDQRAGKAPQRAARRRGERPQGGPRDGRGEGALRARHDQARRDLRPALARAALNALLTAAAPLLASAFVVWGSPVTWLEVVAFV